MNGQLDSASLYTTKSLDLEKFSRDELIHAYGLGNLGLIHSAQGFLDTAVIELSMATETLEKLGDPYAASYYKSEIGKIYIIQDNKLEGKRLLEESLNIALNEGLKEQIRDISALLSTYHESAGDFKIALNYKRQYQLYNDSLLNIDNVRKIESLRADYNIAQKQNEVNLLSKINRSQRTIGYLLGLGVIGILGFSYVLFKSNKKIQESNKTLSAQKASITKREEEKALLLKELNHRVKNNLQMVASLLNLQSNQVADEEATAALESGKLRVEALSLIHQKLYSRDHHTSIKIKEYLEELVQNLVFTFNDHVKIYFDIDDLSIDIDRAIPLGLIVNELCTNALKYAYSEVDNPKISLTLKSENKNAKLCISDNGKGLDENSESNSASFGLKLTHSLVSQIEGKLIYINDNGCTWQLTFPTNNLKEYKE